MASNQLRSVAVGGALPSFAYRYDGSGNMTEETEARRISWSHADRLKAFRITGGGEPSILAVYLYDAAGLRVKKLVRRRGGQTSSTVYIGDVFEHHRWDAGTQAGENNHVHVMDDNQHIAVVRVGTAHPGDLGPAEQFHFGDHLGSSNVIVDKSGDFINREEFTPYGETSFGSFARKRYRFIGKERDEESGLCYHGARHYAPWLGRWTNPDPAGAIDTFNLYLYSRNNPLFLVDTTGTNSEAARLRTELDAASYEHASRVHELEENRPKLQGEELRLEEQANKQYNKICDLNPADRKYKGKHRKLTRAWEGTKKEIERVKQSINSLSERVDEAAKKLERIRGKSAKAGLPFWDIEKEASGRALSDAIERKAQRPTPPGSTTPGGAGHGGSQGSGGGRSKSKPSPRWKGTGRGGPSGPPGAAPLVSPTETYCMTSMTSTPLARRNLHSSKNSTSWNATWSS